MIRNEELLYWFRLYKETFGEPVPLAELGNRENDELIEAIKKSVEENKNLLPEIFGFIDDPNVLV